MDADYSISSYNMSLHLSSLHLVVQQLNQQWANDCIFIEETGQRQQFTVVRGQVKVA